MAQKDFGLQQLQIIYLESDSLFRLGRITLREFNQTILETLIQLLEKYGQFEPHYSEIKKLAELRWSNPKNIYLHDQPQKLKSISEINISNNQYLQKLKKEYLNFYSDYYSGRVSQVELYQNIIYILFKLLNSGMEAIEPYFTWFEQCADAQLQASLKNLSQQ